MPSDYLPYIRNNDFLVNTENLIKLLTLTKHPFLSYTIPANFSLVGFLNMTIRTLNDLNTNLLMLENLLKLLANKEYNRGEFLT